MQKGRRGLGPRVAGRLRTTQAFGAEFSTQSGSWGQPSPNQQSRNCPGSGSSASPHGRKPGPAAGALALYRATPRVDRRPPGTPGDSDALRETRTRSGRLGRAVGPQLGTAASTERVGEAGRRYLPPLCTAITGPPKGAVTPGPGRLGRS